MTIVVATAAATTSATAARVTSWHYSDEASDGLFY